MDFDLSKLDKNNLILDKIEEKEVLEIINHLDEKKASGYDNMSITDIKTLMKVLK